MTPDTILAVLNGSELTSDGFSRGEDVCVTVTIMSSRDELEGSHSLVRCFYNEFVDVATRTWYKETYARKLNQTYATRRGLADIKCSIHRDADGRNWDGTRW